MRGELYEVDDNVFANLDILEEHPTFYVREQRQVTSLDDSKEITTWIYFIKTFSPQLLDQQTFESYTNNNSLGLKYDARYLKSDLVDLDKVTIM